MLFTEDLEDIIFERHNIHLSDELIIISGYLGPSPVRKLSTLPMPATVVYGMYGSDGIKTSLHNSLIKTQNTAGNVDIYYSKLPVHSKCYVWRRKKEIVHALIGSANFSRNGLTTPYREMLAETTFDSFTKLNSYIQHVLNNSISCLNQGVTQTSTPIIIGQGCLMTLLDPRKNEVQITAGLNWGQNPKNHTKPNDAYISIRTSHIKKFTNLFPPKKSFPNIQDGRGRVKGRHNDAIEMIWDDGITMEGLFEGTQPVLGDKYPKQISSFPQKNQLGEYIRQRIGVPSGQPVRKHHLVDYGRTDIEISLISEGIYKFDFSV